MSTHTFSWSSKKNIHILDKKKWVVAETMLFAVI